MLIYCLYTLSQKNDTNSNSYISDTDYPIFVIFYSPILGESKKYVSSIFKQFGGPDSEIW